ncbi:MAG: hypothetical protein HC875_10995 [Anaerolineales bacterium]|nr:hypothetical protein [Anaerolineales bacterium]
MSNILIVESKNDKCFVEALVTHLNLQNISIDEPICRIDDFECLNGVHQAKITDTLKALKADLIKKDVQKVGIILDHDSRPEEKSKWINEAIAQVFDPRQQVTHPGEFIPVSINVDGIDLNFSLAYFLTQVDAKGELETLLKAIKAQPSLYADCLENWKNCVEDQGGKITDKDFDKFWVNNYIRFDTCSEEEKKQAARKCSMNAFEYVMTHKPDIWNLDHSLLDDFKAFLTLFV